MASTVKVDHCLWTLKCKNINCFSNIHWYTSLGLFDQYATVPWRDIFPNIFPLLSSTCSLYNCIHINILHTIDFPPLIDFMFGTTDSFNVKNLEVKSKFHDSFKMYLFFIFKVDT